MARPPMEIGTAGSITTQQHPEKRSGMKWKATCNFRDYDGRVRKIERWGHSKDQAKRALSAAIRDRMTPTGSDIGPQTTVDKVAERWFARMQATRSANTIRAYRNILDRHILPGLGKVRLSELSAGYLDDFMDVLAARRGLSAEYRRSIRSVLSGVLALAVRVRALPSNPVREMSRIEGGPSRAPRSLTADERVRLLERLDDLRCGHHHDAPAAKAQGCGMCATARTDLAPLVRFMLGTGCRIGEALAVRWCDLDLVGTTVDLGDGVTVPVRTAALGPTIVRLKGRGLVRQEAGKTEAATRTVPLPEFLVTMLTVRRAPDAIDTDPVFPSRAHTWRDPNAAARMLREARPQLGLDFPLTTHVFRKTAITILDGEKLTARQIADLVGHAKPSMTQDVYMGRGQVSPAAALALDAALRTQGLLASE